jgi:hypothetical protein
MSCVKLGLLLSLLLLFPLAVQAQLPPNSSCGGYNGPNTESAVTGGFLSVTDTYTEGNDGLQPLACGLVLRSCASGSTALSVCSGISASAPNATLLSPTSYLVTTPVQWIPNTLCVPVTYFFSNLTSAATVFSITLTPGGVNSTSCQPPCNVKITTTNLANGTVSSAYSQALVGLGGTAPYQCCPN